MTPLNKPVVRVTRGPLQNFGPDRDRRFVVTLMPGDVLSLRPWNRRDPSARVDVKLSTVYETALFNRVLGERLKKARDVKAKKLQAKKDRALKRAVQGEQGHG